MRRQRESWHPYRVMLAAVAALVLSLAGCAALPPRLTAELQPDPPGANHYQKPQGAAGAGQSVATR